MSNCHCVTTPSQENMQRFMPQWSHTRPKQEWVWETLFQSHFSTGLNCKNLNCNYFDIILIWNYCNAFHRKFQEISRSIWSNDDHMKRKTIQIPEPLLRRLMSDQDNVSYEMFLKLTFAWENFDSNFPSMFYLFRGINTNCKGYLEKDDLQYHYQVNHIMHFCPLT